MLLFGNSIERRMTVKKSYIVLYHIEGVYTVFAERPNRTDGFRADAQLWSAPAGATLADLAQWAGTGFREYTKYGGQFTPEEW